MLKSNNALIFYFHNSQPLKPKFQSRWRLLSRME